MPRGRACRVLFAKGKVVVAARPNKYIEEDVQRQGSRRPARHKHLVCVPPNWLQKQGKSPWPRLSG